ncbi:MAG: superoxide dismutase [bacterium]|nr:superoxide dismutase [bacterium]
MFELPKLQFEYNALEPFIDQQTMKIHHDLHHGGYVTKLNTALEGNPEFQNKSVEELLQEIESLPESIRMAVRNNGGGHFNHSLFWNILSSEKSEPSSQLTSAIGTSFGSFALFQEQFTNTAATRFGSGWAWLVKKEDGTLEVLSTPNQDNPLMHKAGIPILALDVWEHAYYLKYQNRRPEYINAFWSIVNWKKVSELFGS